MTTGVAELDDRVRTWWAWFAVALFLLIPVDLFTTLLAVAEYGAAVESNPLVRWLLEQGMVAVTLANLVVVALAAYLFHAVVESVRGTSSSYRTGFVYLVNAWIGFALVAGVFLTANNVLVIV